MFAGPGLFLTQYNLISAGRGFVEVFMCFFCEKEFGNRDSLYAHQKCCANRRKEQKVLSQVVNIVLPVIKRGRVVSSF